MSSVTSSIHMRRPSATDPLQQQEDTNAAPRTIQHGRSESYPVADELRKQGVPFVFASAYGQDRIPLRFADVNLWQKPYSEDALVEDTRRLCEETLAGQRTISSARPPPA